MMLDPGPDANTDPEGEPDWGFLVTHATDRYWHRLTGMCGGCGRADCHDGPCVGNASGYCTTCPTRRATGEVRG
jgi:hypothetical protein